MKMTPDSQLLKGNTPTLVLIALRDGPSHGYAIAQQINRRSEGALSLKQASLYPALHALERDGLIEGAWAMEDTDRPRRVYTITAAGEEELARRLRSWSLFTDAMSRVIEGAPGGEPA